MDKGQRVFLTEESQLVCFPEHWAHRMTTKKFGSRGSCIVSSASLASRSLPLVLLLVANLLSGLLVTKIAQLFNLFTGKTVFRAGVK